MTWDLLVFARFLTPTVAASGVPIKQRRENNFPTSLVCCSIQTPWLAIASEVRPQGQDYADVQCPSRAGAEDSLCLLTREGPPPLRRRGGRHTWTGRQGIPRRPAGR